MKSEPDKKGALEMSPSRTLEVLQPVLRVAIFTGYTHQNYRLQGILGGFVWFIMLVTHGTLDFLAARQVYTYGWASVSLSLVLLCLVCTIFTNRRTLPWLEKGMSLLEDEQKYAKTLNRFEKVFKVRLDLLLIRPMHSALLCTVMLSVASIQELESFHNKVLVLTVLDNI